MSIHDPVEGRFLNVAFLAKCIRQVKTDGKYIPSVLVLSREDFNGHFYAIALHGQSHHIVGSYQKLGIKKLVWAHDVADGEFLLSSGEGLPSGIETIQFKGIT
jgi:hypothetical protein